MIVLSVFKIHTIGIKEELTTGRADLFLDAKTLKSFGTLITCERGHIENFGSVTNSHRVNPFF
jgi:hypothetical protein